uniref:Predicted DNA binding protein, CopG/RHH family n=1 Tax=Candidatus Kentrum sp. SD TaxID=2126332 RepID=A0A451BPD6_9GAMM|nr:MAG: Predicted DNA binding protein, CopG/RHH family [Candidatus Kentron sp. SD]
MTLTKEEKEILDSVENGEWRRVPNFEQEAMRYQKVAEATLRKDKRVNICMTGRDFVHIQKTAMRKGLSYQALIDSILHKYVNGQLIEKAG